MNQNRDEFSPLGMDGKVETPSCSHCTRKDCGCQAQSQGRALGTSGTVDDKGHVEFFSVSVVPAPECSACHVKMIPADRSHWKCPQIGCTICGMPLDMGVYPMFEVPK